MRRSGSDHTIIRAAWVAQSFSEGALRAPLPSGVLPMPGGTVAEPIIGIDDIADAACAALTEPLLSGAMYEVTGPRRSPTGPRISPWRWAGPCRMCR